MDLSILLAAMLDDPLPGVIAGITILAPALSFKKQRAEAL